MSNFPKTACHNWLATSAMGTNHPVFDTPSLDFVRSPNNSVKYITYSSFNIIARLEKQPYYPKIKTLCGVKSKKLPGIYLWIGRVWRDFMWNLVKAPCFIAAEPEAQSGKGLFSPCGTKCSHECESALKSAKLHMNVKNFDVLIWLFIHVSLFMHGYSCSKETPTFIFFSCFTICVRRSSINKKY